MKNQCNLLPIKCMNSALVLSTENVPVKFDVVVTEYCFLKI